MLYKMRAGLLKAFKNHSNAALYSEEIRGAVPTHKGGGTLLDGRGTLIGGDEMMVHERAAEIWTHGHSGGMTYADALEQARKEIADKNAAEKRGPRFGEVQFNECRGIAVDPDSARIAKRAKEIVAEKKWPSGRFGEALKVARAEARNE